MHSNSPRWGHPTNGRRRQVWLPLWIDAADLQVVWSRIHIIAIQAVNSIEIEVTGSGARFRMNRMHHRALLRYMAEPENVACFMHDQFPQLRFDATDHPQSAAYWSGFRWRFLECPVQLGIEMNRPLRGVTRLRSSRDMGDQFG
jgi:hypothetical protein